ncbi:hypothetical protein Tco_0787879 [Tanacetum coccineum]
MLLAMGASGVEIQSMMEICSSGSKGLQLYSSRGSDYEETFSLSLTIYGAISILISMKHTYDYEYMADGYVSLELEEAVGLEALYQAKYRYAIFKNAQDTYQDDIICSRVLNWAKIRILKFHQLILADPFTKALSKRMLTQHAREMGALSC